jgi:hypothetical protein
MWKASAKPMSIDCAKARPPEAPAVPLNDRHFGTLRWLLSNKLHRLLVRAEGVAMFLPCTNPTCRNVAMLPLSGHVRTHL